MRWAFILNVSAADLHRHLCLLAILVTLFFILLYTLLFSGVIERLWLTSEGYWLRYCCYVSRHVHGISGIFIRICATLCGVYLVFAYFLHPRSYSKSVVSTYFGLDLTLAIVGGAGVGIIIIISDNGGSSRLTWIDTRITYKMQQEQGQEDHHYHIMQVAMYASFHME